MSAADIANALGGKRNGVGWLVRCPVPKHGKGLGDRNPSMSMVDGDQRLLVRCFAGCDTRDILHELRQLGLLQEDLPLRIRPQRPRKAEEPEPDPEALAIWQSAVPIDGTPAEAYLRGRGITIPPPPSLRFHSDPPAMVAAVSRPDKKIVAVQRLFLDGTRKVNRRDPRLTTGRYGTGAIRLAGVDTDLGLAEGVETALSAMQLFGIPCWAALGSSRLGRITIPRSVHHVHVFADNDGAGRLGAERAYEAFRAMGRTVTVRYPASGSDFNDILTMTTEAA